MKALTTTRQLFSTAAFTGALFALPMGLALLWTVDLPEVEIQLVANPAPLVAAFALDEVAREMAPAELDALEPASEVSLASMAAALTPRPPREGPVRAAGMRTRTPERSIAATAKPAKIAAKATGAKKARPCEDANPGIQAVENGFYAVDRAIVDRYAKKPATLGALGWVARHDGADGKADGFRLGGITCGNDLHVAGLRNGDVVHSVNGKPLTSTAQALWAYTTQRKKDEIDLEITRKGKARILKYRMS